MEVETAPAFLADSGEMGALMRAFDWASTPVGPPSAWPQSLRTIVRVVLNSQHPMFIFWGPEHIGFYNDAYRETMGPEMHPGTLGARGRESWADIWPIIGPQIELVMRGEGSTWNVDQLVPIRRHGKVENVWWTYGYSPIDLGGTVGGVLVVCSDVTQQHLLTESLKDQTRRLSQQFEQAPGFIAVLRGPKHTFELANAAYRQLIGGREVLGRAVEDALPEVAEQGFIDLLDTVYRTGTPHSGRRTPLTLQAEGEAAHSVFLDFVYQPIIEPDGQVSGIFVEGQDVTDHVAAEERLLLINSELKHRVKNTLAMVGAVASQTLRREASAAGMQAFNDRLSAFAAAHDALTAASEPTAVLRNVIDNALKPHRSGEDRFEVAGPPVTIGSRQALALALAVHELATNAAKYGALSVPHGRVELAWELEPGDDGIFNLSWRERGGPPVAAPTSRGFGSRLIERVLAAEFGGEINVDYNPEGVAVRVRSTGGGLR